MINLSKLFQLAGLFWLVALSSGAMSQIRSEDLNVIAAAVNKICIGTPLNSKNRQVELSGDAKGRLSDLFRRLADLGVEGAAKFQETTTFGVLQKDLARSLESGNDCRKDITKVIINNMSRNGRSELDSVSVKKLVDAKNACREGNFSRSERILELLISDYPQNNQVLQERDYCEKTKNLSIDIEIFLLSSSSIFVKGSFDRYYKANDVFVNFNGIYCGVLSSMAGQDQINCTLKAGQNFFEAVGIDLYHDEHGLIARNLQCNGQLNISPNNKRFSMLICYNKKNITCIIESANTEYKSSGYSSCNFNEIQ